MNARTSSGPALANSDAPISSHRSWTRRLAMLSVAALASAFSVVGVGSTTARAADFVPVPVVPLGLVETFGILSPAAVGNAANTAGAPPTTIRGDVGAGGAITGFGPGWGVITGTVYDGATAITAQMAALNTAYNDAKGRAAGAAMAASISGLTFAPGVHTTAAAVGTAAATSFTLDGQGHPDAVFIFQIGGALSLGANTTMVLTGGAQAKNVFWAVTGAGGIGANTKFAGTLIAGTAVSSGDGSTINGRLTSLTGAITMSATQLYSAPPTVSIAGGAAASSTSPTPVITGSTNAGASLPVTITIDNTVQTPSVTPSSGGAWTFQAPLLINGDHVIVASSVDGAGNVGSYTQTLTVDTTPPAVTIDGGPSATTNDLTPTISGTTDVAAGQLVRVTLTNTATAITLTRNALVQDDFTWNISPNGLTAGNWTVVARVVDPAGNPGTISQALFIDATAPAVTITSSALTNNPTPTITGTTEAGATVVVNVDGLAISDVQVSGTTWTAQTTAALANGEHRVSAAATDAVGNTTSPAVTQSLTVDLVLPIIGINPGATDSTNDRTPTIVGTTDVTPGPGVIVFVSIDGAASLTALVQSDGWNVTPSALLSLGVHTVVARVSDPAGNVGTFSQTLTIDVTAPSVVISGGPARTTADATPTISGSSLDVPVGSPVTVTINGQTLTTTIGVDGTYSVTAATIPNGTHFAFVTVTDAARNTGNANQALTINAVPPVVTYGNGPTASTNDSTPLIEGTTDAPAGSPVLVTAAGQTLQATVQPGGSWNVTAAHIDNGVVTVTTRITDSSGNVGSADQLLTIGADTPTSIVIDGGTNRATNDNAPTISGTTDAADGRVLTVTVAGQTMTVPAGSHVWSVTATRIDDGVYPVSVSVDAIGGNPGTATQSLTIDTVVPIVVIAGGSGTVETTDPTPPITGSGATPGSTVSVTVGGQTLTTTVTPAGTWTVTPTTPLRAGTNPVTVTITDPAGNVGTGTQTINLTATATTITIDGGTTAATNDSTPTISGSTNAANGRQMTVTIASQTLTTTVAGGLWAVDATNLADGTYNVMASVSDADGTPAAASQSLTIDTVAPVVITTLPSQTTDPTPPITGTGATPGSTVSVTVAGQTMTTTVATDGTWTVTPPNPLPAGSNQATITITDQAGNSGTGTQTVTVVAEPAPTTITIAGGATMATKNATPTISGSTNAVSGRLITVTLAGQTLTTTASAGTWSVTAARIDDGTYSAAAAINANDGSPATASQSLTIDTVAPVVLPSTVETADPTPSITGSGQTPGSTVSVEVAGQTLTTTVASDGTWSVTPPNALPAGDNAATVTITDPAGNSATGTQTIKVVATATSITINGGISALSKNATPTISGSTTAANGRALTVTIGGQTMTTTIANGVWSVTAAALADRQYNVTAAVTFTDGTPASTSQTLTIDTVAPAVVLAQTVATTDPTPTIAGTGQTPGSTVTVTVAGQTMTTTVAPDGTWSVTPPNALPAGANSTRVTITDPAGNTATDTQTINVVAAATSITINGGISAASNDATPTISGATTAADGRVLTVTIGGQTMTTTIAGGVWTVDAASLDDGEYDVTAAVTVADGTAASASQTLTIDTVVPVVVLPPSVETNSPTPAITGSGATPGSTVSVTVAGQTLTTTVAPDGTWSVTPTSPLPAGANPATVTITDPAGNTGTATQTITVKPGAFGPSSPVNPDGTAEYTSVGPKRVFDTRTGQSPNALRGVAKKQVSGGYELQVQMTDLAGYVPATGVGAVSLNVTSTESSASGFLTVYSCGTREQVSSVNFPAGKTVANAVVAPVSASGAVCFYANTPTDIIVDINGWFAAGAAFNAVGPKRVFDTRPGESSGALRTVAQRKVAAGSMIEVQVTDLAGYVPTNGVGSVSLNVVVTNPEAPGFITVYSCGTRAQVSSVNFVAGQTVANAVNAPVSASGTVCFYSLATTDLIVDINGWIEAGSSFHGLDPARVLDTRAGESSNALRNVAKAKIGGGNILQVQVTDLPGLVPATGVAAVSLNVTATNTEGPGFVTVFACGSMEEVSSLNYDAGATVANAVLAPVSSTGTICLYSNQRTDVIVDINAWLGAAQPG